MSRLRKPRSGSLLELVVIVVVALGLALAIQALLVKPYRIPSPSMFPTLHVGQRVLVNRIGARFNDPSIGDIVVFHPPRGAESNQCGVAHTPTQPCPQPTPQRSAQNFIKRVVAGPGDTIAINGGRVTRNGKPQADKFTAPCHPADPSERCDFHTAIRVPPGHWFMMGDNRGASDDSRFWGPVPKKWIIGGAFATYWPPDRIGFL
ncbi:MAG TPA: signal peptidase I [Solirubrobacteraceae bacterium]|nr:signal peptidase I [Solirubrobacteraceae bacterium]